MRLSSVSLFVILSRVTQTEPKRSLKVLVYSSSVAYSHMQFQGTLADLLVDAGHEVHVLIPDRMPTQVSNGTRKAHRVIRFPSPRAKVIGKELFQVLSTFGGSKTEVQNIVIKLLPKSTFCECQDVLENVVVFDFLKAQKYDVAIAETWLLCPFSLFHALNIPTRLGSCVIPLSTYLAASLGIPSPASFVPLMFSATVHGDRMPFLERLRNLSYHVTGWLSGKQLLSEIDQLYRAKFGNHFPSVQEIVDSISLVFINANPFFDLPRPISHKTVYVGGIVEKKPKPLSLEIEDIYRRSKRGVVLFAFGSMIDVANMPLTMRTSFMAAFARFPEYQFIWKSRTNTNDTERLPRNVHIFEWIDQVSVLAHPKTLAFITHCGMNSINEAATHGVPMIAIPLVSDGLYNAAAAVKQQTAVYVDVDRITSRIVIEALQKVLNDLSYREHALAVKKKIASVPFRASETFVRWTEFAAEHGNLSELNLASVGMNDFVYHSLDVIATLTLLVVVFPVIGYFIICAVARKAVIIFLSVRSVPSSGFHVPNGNRKMQ